MFIRKGVDLLMLVFLMFVGTRPTIASVLVGSGCGMRVPFWWNISEHRLARTQFYTCFPDTGLNVFGKFSGGIIGGAFCGQLRRILFPNQVL